MSRVMVTGATGFVGAHLVDRLLRDGVEVVSLSHADGDIAHANLDLPDIEHVFHLAARTFVPETWDAPGPFFETNILGTLNVLEFCRRTGASATIVSSYVYGEPERLPIAEGDPVRAFNPYSLTKILAEQTARFYEPVHGLRISIVRPFNLYGPGQNRRFLIPSIAEKALDPSLSIIAVADERPRRDFLHIDDFIDLLKVCRNAGAIGIFNAGSGRSFSVGEVASLVNAAAGTNKPIVSLGKVRPAEVLDVVADIGMAQRELGWEPATPIERGIAAVVGAINRFQG